MIDAPIKILRLGSSNCAQIYSRYGDTITTESKETQGQERKNNHIRAFKKQAKIVMVYKKNVIN